MVDYFTEVFPINTNHIEHLSAYQITLKRDHPDIIIDDLLPRLVKAFGGHWVWSGQQLWTDQPPSPVQMEITLDLIRDQYSDVFGRINSIQEIEDWQPTIEDAAHFVALACSTHYEQEIRPILREHGVRLHNAYIMLDYRINGWEVNAHPALSLSLLPRVLYIQNVQRTLDSGQDLTGIGVIDKTNARRIGTIRRFAGNVGEQREDLLAQTGSEQLRAIIQDADDATQVALVDFGTHERLYAATALNIVLTPDDYAQFGINTSALERARIVPPDVMARIVSSVTDLLKNDGIIDSAFNNRSHPEHFIYLNHVPEMQFDRNVVRPYEHATLADDFVKHGLFATHPRFKQDAIRIAVINALETSIATDFIEAMRRQLERDFALQIEMIRERSVRVVSEANLASAVRVVEKENPHILLACFADDQDGAYAFVKRLTLGKGIATHALYEATMNDPDAMARVMMAVLAKTGNTPFVLAEPFEAANLVVGLAWVREQLTRGDRLAGMSRIYRRDGYFMRYFLDIQEVETGESPPIKLIQQLFPEPIFKGKRVIVHHYGPVSDDVANLLHEWATHIQAELTLVEIITQAVPHIYALQDGIAAPPWGSVFVLNPGEAFVVSSSPETGTMPDTTHLRLRYGDIMIEQAVYTVLALSLINYGTETIPRLPVTVGNADKLAGWFARGMLPDNIHGDVPFWL